MPKINGRLETQQDVSWITNVVKEINVLSFTSHPMRWVTCHNLLAHLPPVFCLNVFRPSVPKKSASEWLSWIWCLDWLLMNPNNVAIFFCTWKIVPVPAWVPWAVWSSPRLRGALWYNPYQKRPAGKGKKKCLLLTERCFIITWSQRMKGKGPKILGKWNILR